MRHILAFLTVCCTIGLQAYGYTVIWRTGTQDKYVKRYPRNTYVNTGVSRHGHDTFCQCKFHVYGRDPQTEPARLAKREGGRIEHVEDAGNGKMLVTTMTLCMMCNGTGRSMSRTCSRCNGNGVQVRKVLKPMSKKRNIYIITKEF